jgi:integrase
VSVGTSSNGERTASACVKPQAQLLPRRWRRKKGKRFELDAKELFAEYAAPKSDARDIAPEDIKKSLAWRKSKGLDPGTTLYTNRVILHNFFNKLGIENPVKKVPRLPKFRKRPVAYPETELLKFFAVCDDWERAFFSLVLATGLRRGELQTLHWPDLDLAHRRVHVRAKPQYAFLPKDWEERTVPFSKELAEILKSIRGPRTVPWYFLHPSILAAFPAPATCMTSARPLPREPGYTRRNGISTASATPPPLAGCGQGLTCAPSKSG